MRRIQIDLLHDGYDAWWKDVQARGLENDPTLDGNWTEFMRKHYGVNVIDKGRAAEIYMVETDYVWFSLKFHTPKKRQFD
jgi:hypothetical protein